MLSFLEIFEMCSLPTQIIFEMCSLRSQIIFEMCSLRTQIIYKVLLPDIDLLGALRQGLKTGGVSLLNQIEFKETGKCFHALAWQTYI